MRTNLLVPFALAATIGTVGASAVGVAVTESGVLTATTTTKVAAASASASPRPAASTAAPDPAVTTASAAATTSSGTFTAVPAVAHLPRLGKLRTPDLLAVASRTITTRQLDRLRRSSGVTKATLLDWGKVRVGSRGSYVRAVGVDPAGFREFTPKLTARSRPLWKSIARGELTLSFSQSNYLGHQLGAWLPTRDHLTRSVRLGAFASIGVGNVQAVLSHQLARSLGVPASRAVLIAAPKLTLDDLRATTTRLLGAHVHLQYLRPQTVDQGRISAYAASIVPASYLQLYRAAATTCPGLPWTVLAAIGTVESNNGSNAGVSSKGAMGPMQFLPSTFAFYGVDANGDGKADINNPVDAIYSAARYLCANGAGRGGQALADAIFAYNHAWWYVREVVALAWRYQ